MSFRPTDLHSIPLFAEIPEGHLERLVGAFARRRLEAGEVLFRRGDLADQLILLVEGLVEVQHDDGGLQIRPFAPVGEVGALTNLRRATTAVAAEPSQVLTITTVDLVTFFEHYGEIALRCHHNLLHILADKLERDHRRIEEMRHNVIETQKGLKRMRDALLDAEDTALHRMLFEEMDALVERNRRGHYLAGVPRALATHLRLDDGSLREVVRMSNERLHLAAGGGPLPPAGAEWIGVLVMPDGEIPLTGTVEEPVGDETVLGLGLLIDEYAATLERHLVRLQLLDVVL